MTGKVKGYGHAMIHWLLMKHRIRQGILNKKNHKSPLNKIHPFDDNTNKTG
jgi:hypothetical protein